MKKIFITGESGTIPLAIQKIIAMKKWPFEVINRQIPDRQLVAYKSHQNFIIRQPEIDFTNLDGFNHLFEDVEIIIHSGAYVGTDFCKAKPTEAIRTNIEGTKNIVDICNKFGIKLIYYSTTAIFDPDDYGDGSPITENTRINPQTLYGITKCAGEMIVKRLCKTPKLILRPVFGFGDYPEDLHSALTKVIYTTLQPESSQLNVLLDPKIRKSYTRVENIALATLSLMISNIWNQEINVGINHTEAKNWDELFEIIQKACPQKLDFSKIHFDGTQDYLHYHNIDNSKLSKWVPDFDFYHELKDGISSTIKSVINNSNIKPYWMI
jgi:nucleoside-diphosphate-sugar epimerase